MSKGARQPLAVAARPARVMKVKPETQGRSETCGRIRCRKQFMPVERDAVPCPVRGRLFHDHVVIVLDVVRKAVHGDA